MERLGIGSLGPLNEDACPEDGVVKEVFGVYPFSVEGVMIALEFTEELVDGACLFAGGPTLSEVWSWLRFLEVGFRLGSGSGSSDEDPT